jgi:RNA polymerase primary sigma factor
VPVHVIEIINKLEKASRDLSQKYGRDPTFKEIGEELKLSTKKVREIKGVSMQPISLELPMGGDDSDSYLGDFIKDDKTIEPLDGVSNQLRKEQISDTLSILTPREQKVLKLRFGLEDGRARTLEEVGAEFSLTRELIRQVEAKALRKLRQPAHSRKLLDYLEY